MMIAVVIGALSAAALILFRICTRVVVAFLVSDTGREEKRAWMDDVFHDFVAFGATLFDLGLEALSSTVAFLQANALWLILTTFLLAVYSWISVEHQASIVQAVDANYQVVHATVLLPVRAVLNMLRLSYAFAVGAVNFLSDASGIPTSTAYDIAAECSNPSIVSDTLRNLAQVLVELADAFSQWVSESFRGSDGETFNPHAPLHLEDTVEAVRKLISGLSDPITCACPTSTELTSVVFYSLTTNTTDTAVASLVRGAVMLLQVPALTAANLAFGKVENATAPGARRRLRADESRDLCTLVYEDRKRASAYAQALSLCPAQCESSSDGPCVGDDVRPEDLPTPPDSSPVPYLNLTEGFDNIVHATNSFAALFDGHLVALFEFFRATTGEDLRITAPPIFRVLGFFWSMFLRVVQIGADALLGSPSFVQNRYAGHKLSDSRLVTNELEKVSAQLLSYAREGPVKELALHAEWAAHLVHATGLTVDVLYQAAAALALGYPPNLRIRDIEERLRPELVARKANDAGQMLKCPIVLMSERDPSDPSEDSRSLAAWWCLEVEPGECALNYSRTDVSWRGISDGRRLADLPTLLYNALVVAYRLHADRVQPVLISFEESLERALFDTYVPLGNTVKRALRVARTSSYAMVQYALYLMGRTFVVETPDARDFSQYSGKFKLHDIDSIVESTDATDVHTECLSTIASPPFTELAEFLTTLPNLLYGLLQARETQRSRQTLGCTTRTHKNFVYASSIRMYRYANEACQAAYLNGEDVFCAYTGFEYCAVTGPITSALQSDFTANPLCESGETVAAMTVRATQLYRLVLEYVFVYHAAIARCYQAGYLAALGITDSAECVATPFKEIPETVFDYALCASADASYRVVSTLVSLASPVLDLIYRAVNFDENAQELYGYKQEFWEDKFRAYALTGETSAQAECASQDNTQDCNAVSVCAWVPENDALHRSSKGVSCIHVEDASLNHIQARPLEAGLITLGATVLNTPVYVLAWLPREAVRTFREALNDMARIADAQGGESVKGFVEGFLVAIKNIAYDAAQMLVATWVHVVRDMLIGSAQAVRGIVATSFGAGNGLGEARHNPEDFSSMEEFQGVIRELIVFLQTVVETLVVQGLRVLTKLAEFFLYLIQAFLEPDNISDSIQKAFASLGGVLTEFFRVFGGVLQSVIDNSGFGVVVDMMCRVLNVFESVGQSIQGSVCTVITSEFVPLSLEIKCGGVLTRDEPRKCLPKIDLAGKRRLLFVKRMAEAGSEAILGSVDRFIPSRFDIEKYESLVGLFGVDTPKFCEQEYRLISSCRGNENYNKRLSPEATVCERKSDCDAEGAFCWVQHEAECTIPITNIRSDGTNQQIWFRTCPCSKVKDFNAFGNCGNATDESPFCNKPKDDYHCSIASGYCQAGLDPHIPPLKSCMYVAVDPLSPPPPPPPPSPPEPPFADLWRKAPPLGSLGLGGYNTFLGARNVSKAMASSGFRPSLDCSKRENYMTDECVRWRNDFRHAMQGTGGLTVSNLADDMCSITNGSLIGAIFPNPTAQKTIIRRDDVTYTPMLHLTCYEDLGPDLEPGLDKPVNVSMKTLMNNTFECYETVLKNECGQQGCVTQGDLCIPSRQSEFCVSMNKNSSCAASPDWDSLFTETSTDLSTCEFTFPTNLLKEACATARQGEFQPDFSKDITLRIIENGKQVTLNKPESYVLEDGKCRFQQDISLSIPSRLASLGCERASQIMGQACWTGLDSSACTSNPTNLLGFSNAKRQVYRADELHAVFLFEENLRLAGADEPEPSLTLTSLGRIDHAREDGHYVIILDESKNYEMKDEKADSTETSPTAGDKNTLLNVHRASLDIFRGYLSRSPSEQADLNDTSSIEVFARETLGYGDVQTRLPRIPDCSAVGESLCSRDPNATLAYNNNFITAGYNPYEHGFVVFMNKHDVKLALFASIQGLSLVVHTRSFDDTPLTNNTDHQTAFAEAYPQTLTGGLFGKIALRQGANPRNLTVTLSAQVQTTGTDWTDKFFALSTLISTSVLIDTSTPVEADLCSEVFWHMYKDTIHSHSDCNFWYDMSDSGFEPYHDEILNRFVFTDNIETSWSPMKLVFSLNASTIDIAQVQPASATDSPAPAPPALSKKIPFGVNSFNSSWFVMLGRVREAKSCDSQNPCAPFSLSVNVPGLGGLGPFARNTTNLLEHEHEGARYRMLPLATSSCSEEVCLPCGNPRACEWNGADDHEFRNATFDTFVTFDISNATDWFEGDYGRVLLARNTTGGFLIYASYSVIDPASTPRRRTVVLQLAGDGEGVPLQSAYPPPPPPPVPAPPPPDLPLLWANEFTVRNVQRLNDLLCYRVPIYKCAFGMLAELDLEECRSVLAYHVEEAVLCRELVSPSSSNQDNHFADYKHTSRSSDTCLVEVGVEIGARGNSNYVRRGPRGDVEKGNEVVSIDPDPCASNNSLTGVSQEDCPSQGRKWERAKDVKLVTCRWYPSQAQPNLGFCFTACEDLSRDMKQCVCRANATSCADHPPFYGPDVIKCKEPNTHELRTWCPSRCALSPQGGCADASPRSLTASGPVAQARAGRKLRDEGEEDFSQFVSECDTDQDCARTLHTYCGVWWMDPPIPCMSCPNRGWMIAGEGALSSVCRDGACACRGAMTRDEADNFDKNAQSLWHQREKMTHEHWPGSSFCDQMVRQYANVSSWSPLEAYVLNGCAYLRERAYAAVAFLRIPTLPPDLFYNPARIPFLVWELGRATAMWFTMRAGAGVEDRYVRAVENHMDPVMTHAWMLQLDRIAAAARDIDVDSLGRRVSHAVGKHVSPKAGAALWELHMEAANFTARMLRAARASAPLGNASGVLYKSIPHVRKVYSIATRATGTSPSRPRLSKPRIGNAQALAASARRVLLATRATPQGCFAVTTFVKRLKEPFENAAAYYTSRGFRDSLCQFALDMQDRETTHGGLCGSAAEPYRYPTFSFSHPAFTSPWRYVKSTIQSRSQRARERRPIARAAEDSAETYHAFLARTSLNVAEWLAAPIPLLGDALDSLRGALEDLDDFARDPGVLNRTQPVRTGICPAEAVRCERRTEFSLLEATLAVGGTSAAAVIVLGFVPFLRPLTYALIAVFALGSMPAILWLAYDYPLSCFSRAIPSLPTCLADDLYNEFYRFFLGPSKIRWPSSLVSAEAQRASSLVGVSTLPTSSITDCKRLGFRDGYHTLAYLVRNDDAIAWYLNWTPWFEEGMREWRNPRSESAPEGAYTACVFYTLPGLVLVLIPYLGIFYTGLRIAGALLRTFFSLYQIVPRAANKILSFSGVTNDDEFAEGQALPHRSDSPDENTY